MTITNSVTERNRVVVDGKAYLTEGSIIPQLASEYSPRIVFGESSRAVRPRTDTLALTDFRGGIGKEFIEVDRDAERLYESTFNHLYHNHLVLPPQARSFVGPASGHEIEAIEVLGGKLYAFADRAVYRWAATTGWSSALITISGSLNILKSLSVGEDTYLFLTHSDGVLWTSDGDTWSDQDTARDDSGDIDLPGAIGHARGIVWDGTRFLVGDATDRKYYGVDTDGNRVTTHDSPTLPDGIQGLAAPATRRYALTEDNFIRVLNASHQRQTALDLDLDGIVEDGRGIITKSDGTILVADAAARKMVAIEERDGAVNHVSALDWAVSGSGSLFPVHARYGGASASRLYSLTDSSTGNTRFVLQVFDTTTGIRIDNLRHRPWEDHLFTPAGLTDTEQDNFNITFNATVGASGTLMWFYDSGNNKMWALNLSDQLYSASGTFDITIDLSGGQRLQRIIHYDGVTYALTVTSGSVASGSVNLYSSAAPTNPVSLTMSNISDFYDDGVDAFIHDGILYIPGTKSSTTAGEFEYLAWTLAGARDTSKDIQLTVTDTTASFGTFSNGAEIIQVQLEGNTYTGRFHTLGAELVHLPEGDWDIDVQDADVQGVTRRGDKVDILDAGGYIHVYTEDGSPLVAERAALPLAITDAGGLTNDGDYWWIVDHSDDKIYRLPFVSSNQRFVQMVEWNDKLWGINSTGQMYSRLSLDATDIWTEDAKIATRNTPVTNLLVYAGSQGGDALYAITAAGMFEHNAANEEFAQTDLTFSNDREAGLGAVVWRGDLYVSSGLAIYRIGSGQTVVIDLVGWDRDDGSPFDGKIIHLAATNNYLLALVQSREAGGDSYIMAYNRLAWWPMWKNVGTHSHALWAGEHSGGFHLYAGSDESLARLAIPRGIVNPSIVLDATYAPSAEATTPWFLANEPDLDKVALNLRTELLNGDSGESRYVEIDYQLRSDDDDGETWHTVEWNGNVQLTARFAESQFLVGNQLGRSFREMRFRIRANRGSDDTRFPDLQALTLEYIKVQPPKYAFQLTINLERSFEGRTPKQMRGDLEALSGAAHLVPFNYDADPDRVVYVRSERPVGNFLTGRNPQGAMTLFLVEL